MDESDTKADRIQQRCDELEAENNKLKAKQGNVSYYFLCLFAIDHGHVALHQ